MNSTNVVSTIVESGFDSDLLPDAILTPQTSDDLLADSNDFLVYLKRICAFILGFTSLNSIDIGQLFSDRSSHNSVERFIGDGRCQVLFVSKVKPFTEYSSLIKRDASVDIPTTIVSSSSSFNLYTLSNKIQDINPNCLSLVVVKRSPTIVNDKNYQIQLQIIDFIDRKQHEALFGELLDGQRIDLPEMLLTTHVIAAQGITNLIRNVIQGSMNNKSNGMSLFDERFGTDSRIFSGTM